MATYKDKSFWLTTRDYEPGSPLLDSIDVDVAVIGAGFTGLSTAYFLHQAEPGLRIAVLEADVVGYGASGRNAGFSMTKIGMLSSVTKLRFGRQSAVEAHAYADRAVTLVRDLVRDLDLDCDYEHPGLLTVATSTAHARRLDKELALADELGLMGVERIDADALAERVVGPLYVGDGWWEPNCGILNPAKLAWSWKRVIESAGIEVFEETPVLEVSRTGKLDDADHTTRAGAGRQGRVRHERLVPPVSRAALQAGAGVDLHRADRAAHERPTGAIGWAGREGIEDFRDLVHYYRLTADNRIVFGGRDVGLWDGDSMAKDRDETIFAKLRADLQATFPALGEVRFTHAWGGPVSATIDLFPALGYVGGRDWVYSLGCVGHGVSTTHLNGQTIRDLVLERDTDLTDTFFVNRRVPPMPPGPLSRPVIGAIAGFMRWEDKRLDVLPG